MSDVKSFRTETVLSLLTGIAFERGLGGAKELIEFMTSEPTSELAFLDSSATGRVSLCRQKLVEDHPSLKTFYPYDETLDWQAALITAKHFLGDSISIARFNPYPVLS